MHAAGDDETLQLAAPRPARRGPGVLRPVLAVALLLVGLAALGAWRVLSSNEDLPYTSEATPPASSQVTRDHTYSLAVPGGVRAMLAHGVPVSQPDSSDTIGLQCTYSTSSGDSGALPVAAESVSTKAENTVGHFVSPVDGRIHVDCAGWGAMFIPDSDDRSTDYAGWALVISVLALTVGACLGLAELRRVVEGSRGSRPFDEDDEVEGRIDVPVGSGHDDEVVGGQRGDVGQ